MTTDPGDSSTGDSSTGDSSTGDSSTGDSSTGDAAPDAQHLAVTSAGAMWDDDLASRQAGITLVEVGPGRAVATMTVSERMINGHRICHGGYVFMLADTAFALACNTYGPVTVAQACDVVFLRPALLGEELRAEARERVRFGRNGIYDVTVTHAGDTVAEFRGRSRTVGR